MIVILKMRGMEFPRPGRHELSAGWVGESRYVMLVS